MVFGAKRIWYRGQYSVKYGVILQQNISILATTLLQKHRRDMAYI
jgi:hypothetical protein